MTCKDCIHYEVCGGYTPTDLDTDIFDYFRKGIPEEIPDIEERCGGFNNKADVVPRSEVERLQKQLALFRKIGCFTCKYYGTGDDHMPCYRCKDYNEYVWLSADVEISEKEVTENE